MELLLTIGTVGNMDPHQSGIYCIFCLPTQKMYIGSTLRSFRTRWAEHIMQLQTQTHANPYLQHSWLKYGQSAFRFEILEVCDNPDVLRQKEKFYLDLIEPKSLLNIARDPTSGKGNKSRRGQICSEEHKYKISETMRKRHREGKYQHRKTRNHPKPHKPGSKKGPRRAKLVTIVP